MTEMAKDADSNSENLVELILEENGELYYLHVSPANSLRAAKDIAFATELLLQHKSAIDQQALYAIATNTEDDSTTEGSKFVTANIWDETSNAIHTLEVTPAQRDHAIKEKTHNGIATASISAPSMSKGLPSERKRSSTIVKSTGNISSNDKTEESENVNVKKARKTTKNGEQFCCWTEPQAKLLLTLYKDHQAKLDDGSIRSKVFWNIIIKGLEEKGHIFTPAQCSTKMDTFKRAYKKIKDHNAQSGNDKKTCEHFDILDEMFSKKPWIRPLSLAGSNLPMDDLNTNENEKPRNRHTNNSEKLEKSEYMRQCLENQRMRAESTAEYRKQKLQILKDLTSKLSCNVNGV